VNDDRDSLRPPRRLAGARRRHGARLASLLRIMALAGLATGCGSAGSGQTGSGFVFLSVDSFGAPGGVRSSLDDVDAATAVCVTLRNNLKNPTVTAPTSLDNVVIQSYTVSVTRLDGGTVPRTPFTIQTAVTVPAGTGSATGVTGNTATFAIILIPAQVKLEPALRQSRFPISATAQVVFRGRDGRGQRIETDGAVTLTFVNQGTDTAPSC
jgi:hypothetical protein